MLSYDICRDLCMNILAPPLKGELVNILAGPFTSSRVLVTDSQSGWHFYFLLIMIMGYAVAKAYLGLLLPGTFMSTFRYTFAEGMFRDNSQLQRQRDNVLYTFYFLSISFFLLVLSEKYALHPFNLHGFELFLFYLVVLVGIFFGRIILTNIIGTIFYARNLLREYLYTGYTYNKLLGIIFLPLNFLLVFASGILQEIILFSSLSVMAILIFKKIIRGILFSREKGVFSLYLFLYLCALEIVPILLLYKWFSSNV
jgi:MFS family permease